MSKYNKFFGEDWASFLAPILSSKDYACIGDELTRQRDSMKLNIIPEFVNIFRAFKECPLHLLHTVIVGPNVYSDKVSKTEPLADGIAFSAKNSTECPQTLESMLYAIDETIYDGDYQFTTIYDHDKRMDVYDLKLWANQGILLLNRALTGVSRQDSTIHRGLWKPFTDSVIELICNSKDALGVILIGDYAGELEETFRSNPTNFVVTCQHPEVARMLKVPWKHNDVFGRVTTFHKNNNNIHIKW